MKKKFVCRKNKLRLDKFLKENLKDLSRAKIQDLIIRGFVKVNSKIIDKKHYWLKEDDKIVVTPSPSKSLDPSLNPSPRQGREVKIKVIKKTKNYLVLEKPADLIVHPAENVKEYTLVDWLIKKYPQIKKIGDDQINRPGIVHRLDKKASGLMIIALTPEMFKYLKFQFQNRSVTKRYLALVYGKMEDNEGKINFPIERSKRTGKMVAKPEHFGEKDALTLWEVKKQFTHHALLDIQIKTGRTHQIRAHLQAIDHSIVGDNLYKNKEYKDKFNLNRIFLHAYYLEFKDLDNGVQKFETELPEELQNIIEKI